MDERMSEPRADGDAVEVSLTADELELVRNALGNLEAIMGREEADTLERIQALLAKLGR